MKTFKTFLLHETVFNVIEALFSEPDAFQIRIATLWFFYKTNQAAKGIVALHRFYENDDDLIERICNDVANKDRRGFEQAIVEIRSLFHQRKHLYVKETLNRYFLSKEGDKDLLSSQIRGPRLPSKTVSTFIKPKPRSF